MLNGIGFMLTGIMLLLVGIFLLLIGAGGVAVFFAIAGVIVFILGIAERLSSMPKPNTVGSSYARIAQTTCPKCGEKHDIDDVKCPYCGFEKEEDQQ